MKLPISGKGATAYNPMFYAITGTLSRCSLIIGIGFSVVTAFRYWAAAPPIARSSRRMPCIGTSSVRCSSHCGSWCT